jgi:HK97 family phage prohead protease
MSGRERRAFPVSDHETKSLTLEAAEFKAADDGWSFTGYASTYGGEPDSYGDVIKAGAFDDSLKENPTPPLLWAHSMGHPIGIPLKLESNRKGLFGTWRIIDTTAGTDAYKLMKAGAVKGLSIGFYAKDFSEDEKTGIRTLTEIELVEVSAVAVPANKNAQVQAVRQRLPRLDTECKFADLFDQLRAYYDTIAGEAEALRQRRAEDERELSEAHVDALQTAIADAEAFARRLAALRPSPSEAEAEATRDLTAQLRHEQWQLAQDRAATRRRLLARGLLDR